MKYTHNDVVATARGEGMALQEAGLRFISLNALAFVSGVYWNPEDTAKDKAATIKDKILEICEGSGRVARRATSTPRPRSCSQGPCARGSARGRD